MKKLAVIFISLIMILSVMAVPVIAEDIVVIDATEDAISFYDNGLNEGNGTMEKVQGNLMLRPAYEWTAYDISSIKSGTYNVNISYAAIDATTYKFIGLEWIVDGAACTRSYLSKNSETFSGTYGVADCGSIYISKNSRELKVKNIGLYPINLEAITLTYADSADTTEGIKIYAQNVACRADSYGVGAVCKLDYDYYDGENSATPTSKFTELGSDGKYHYPFATNDKIVAGDKLIQHRGDWANYDISDFKAGRYRISIERGQKVQMTYNLKIDGIDVLSASVAATGGYTTYLETQLGYINIPEGAQRLTISGSNSAYIGYMIFEEAEYNVSFDEENVRITGNSKTTKRENYYFSVTVKSGAKLDTESNGVRAVEIATGKELVITAIGDGNYYISKDQIKDDFIIYAKAETNAEVSDNYEGKMSFYANGSDVYIRTNFSDEYDLVQRFIGLKRSDINKNEPIDHGVNGLIKKTDSITASFTKEISLGSDSAAPLYFNSSYMGANHGYSRGVLVTSTSHGKTYADIGSLWQDSSGTKWSLLKVPTENTLLFLGENVAASTTKYSVKNDIPGNTLTYVSHGENTDEITIESKTRYQQILPANKYVYKKVYAVKEGIRIEAEDKVLTDCDYVELEEKYYIMNPVLIGQALREARPEGGYKEPQDLAIGQPLVECNLVYRIMPDGTLLTIFDHKILENINFDYYGGIQYQMVSDPYGGGVYRYIPKSKEFTYNDVTYDYTEPINMTSLTYPSTGMSFYMTSEYWENENNVPDRQVDYFHNSSGDIELSYSSGYLPIFDGDPSVRKDKASIATYIYKTKKTYPYFVDSLAFSETGTKDQTIKGVAYKKFNSESENDISHYTIEYNGKTYVYVDCHEIAEREIILSDILKTGVKFSELEKSENVSYSIIDNVLSVEMTGGTYGYLVLTVDSPAIESEITSTNISTGEVGVLVKNNTSEYKTANVFVATYKNGRLKEIKHENVYLGDEQHYFFTKSFTANTFDQAKVFVWEDLVGMTPISDNALS